MNFKTTLSLVVVLAVAVAGLYLIRQAPTPPALPSIEELHKGQTSRDLLREPLGEMKKIVCSRPGKPDWVFEKTKSDDAAAATWHMTAPSKLAVQIGEAERIARTIQTIQYEVSYKPGEAGAVSAADAGLEPPQLTVALTDVDGKSTTVEVGKAASEQSTYVRLAGTQEVCVGNANLRQLLKSKPVEYRDKQLWTFVPDGVKRLELIDRTNRDVPVNYVFVPDGSKWMMQSPVSARASGKVAAAAQELARLRAIQWVDDNPDKLAVYGLSPGAFTVRATVEKKIEPKADEPKKAPGEEPGAADEKSVEAAAEPRIETAVYELQIADRSPIGEETKVYVRTGDESVVGTVMKTSVDKLRPVMDEWRDMLLTAANVSAATRVELTSTSGALAVALKNGDWTFDANGARAESSAITGMLDAVKNLRAVAFVDNPGAELAKMGFDKPQAELKLTIPGEEAIERVIVGGFTDATSKHLVYVRRNESTSIAKVKAADVAPFLQAPLAFRDRTLFEAEGADIEKIAISRASRHFPGRVAMTLEKPDGGWAMTSPTTGAVRPDRVKKLVDTLTRLRAEGVLDEAGQPSAFGLEDPAIEVTLTVRPPSTYRIEPAADTPAKDGGAEDAAAKADPESTAGAAGANSPDGAAAPVKPVEVRASPFTVRIAVSEHDGKIVAKRDDRPTVFRLGDAVYADMSAELRAPELFVFDEKQVSSFSVRDGEQTHKFERKDNKWVYGPEPDLRLDAKKVDDLLLRIRDLKSERYVAFERADRNAFGLAQPSREVTVALNDGSTRTLQVSSKSSVTDADAGFYAAFAGQPEVFLLTQATLDRFKTTLEQLE